MSEDELFRSLVKSAFEFLEKALSEFEKSAKFSTVHFATAIELFLKARLMKEHWSLLLDKPDQADKAGFFRGEAKTVAPEQAIERLRKIAGVTIPQHSRDVFVKIAQHRNKMVHFIHADDRADTPQATAQIVAEQCEGWLSLRVLLESWSEFDDFQQDIRNVGRQMERHREFLQAKFSSKAEVLKKHRDDGKRVVICPSCGFESVRLEDAHGLISPGSCVVCRYNGSEITLACPNDHCAQEIKCNSYQGPPSECPHCESSIDEDFIAEALDTGEGVNYDNYYDHTDVNCPQCSGYHKGVQHADLYICVQCFESSEVMEICEWCNEGQIGGVSENSYMVGCEFCDGNSSQYRDD
ncbi:hypothetical protein G6K83_11435 [Agrobacterium rhizogenes]|uniref:hypothetical protein n=1 Tax=Rhizobium rhizogenes TaxID=359 RepID=UPI00157432A0|nr:hypothetical protein [Rhizobium rhizogenes]NTH25684.1 hypothetical protein [Rhizobium rhizogenes]